MAPPPRPLRQRWNRLLAELVFMARAPLVLVRPTLSLFLVALLGAAVHRYYGAQPGAAMPTWSEAFFISYCLLMLEHLERVPPHPLAQAVHYLQPLVGVFLLTEGMFKLGRRIFRKDVNPRTWIRIMAKVSKGHVVLCGLGTVGFRVLEELVDMGVPVFCIERDDDCSFLERARELGAEVLVGDARAEGLLRDLNIRQAKAIIVATDNDLANLEIAMDARELAPEVAIVMRLFDQRLAQKVRSTLGIQVTFSTSRLAAPLFASAALDPAVVNTHRIGEQSMVVLELAVGPGMVGRAVADLSRDLRVSILAVQHGGAAWASPPEAQRRLELRDRVQVMVPSDRIAELRSRNAGEAR